MCAFKMLAYDSVRAIPAGHEHPLQSVQNSSDLILKKKRGPKPPQYATKKAELGFIFSSAAKCKPSKPQADKSQTLGLWNIILDFSNQFPFNRSIEISKTVR